MNHQLLLEILYLCYFASCQLSKNLIVAELNPSISLHHIFAIAAFEDYIYWTDWESQAVERCNKYTGKECKQLARFNHRPMDIRIFHPFKQPTGTCARELYIFQRSFFTYFSFRLTVKRNPCKDKGCKGLCLLSPNREAVCVCPDNFILASDGISCEANCSSSHFICPHTYKCIPMWWKCDTRVRHWILIHRRNNYFGFLHGKPILLKSIILLQNVEFYEKKLVNCEIRKTRHLVPKFLHTVRRNPNKMFVRPPPINT